MKSLFVGTFILSLTAEQLYWDIKKHVGISLKATPPPFESASLPGTRLTPQHKRCEML